MSKSHLSSFARNFWRAGREAKKGKSDLQAYLEVQPDDPLALGTMGIFLYFADMIPSVFKFLSRLVLMPTGDREKGLRYMEAATGADSPLKVDFQIAFFNTLLLFEGRYRDGLDGMSGLLTQQPGYSKMALPIALMQIFNPFEIAASTRRVDEVLKRYDGVSPDAAERYSIVLLDFLRAHARRFIAPPTVSEEDLRRIANENAQHPDWVSGYAAFELGRLLASSGRYDEARSSFAWVQHNKRAAFLHKSAAKMIDAIDGAGGGSADRSPPWTAEIYFAPVDTLPVLIARLEKIAPRSVKTAFYRAEALLLSGKLAEALDGFNEALELKCDLWDEEFKMLSASRAAEIHGALGDYGKAEEDLKRAEDFYQKEFLVDWILDGRRRYFHRLQNGEEVNPPRLLVPARERHLRNQTPAVPK
jgi:tetratricopeptide (TPR) repeat protein